MPAVDFDRQAIERRDFPIGRRGYDPAAVDTHLRALAEEFEELQRTAITGGADVSVASTAGTQVQSILQAAETAAAEIERHALENARQVREDADRDADRTREEAIDRARQHVSGVAQVAAKLLEHVGSMDGEVSALVVSLRVGTSRLASDLSAVEANMRELYDASSGRTIDEPAPRPAAEPAPSYASELEEAIAPPAASPPPPPPAAGPPAAQPEEEALHQSDAAPAGADLDGARLVALNMALNGESRADTERYLAENFQVPDRLKLIDEVFAAIEG